MKAIILQRVIPTYRVGLFREVTSNKEIDISLIIGTNIKGDKAKNSKDLSGINYKQLPAKAINIRGRTLTWHKGLLAAIKKENPDVIICEAESHFLGYIIAILYKTILSPNTKLILWCFFALPGIDKERSPLHHWIKRLSRRFFDGFLSYTTYGRDFLTKSGINPKTITVAVNVCDTIKLTQKDRELKLTKSEAKAKLSKSDKFIASYIGTIDKVKKPDIILELAKRFKNKPIHFYIIGSGDYESELKSKLKLNNLTNITMTGRISNGIEEYYRASDVILIPGRGGIVISEAMCFGVPVVTHQADGVEYDLIQTPHTGSILQDGSVDEFERELRHLLDPNIDTDEMGQNSKRTIRDTFNTQTTARAIVSSIIQHARS